jgi:YVTN family beta-propeller protein
LKRAPRALSLALVAALALLGALPALAAAANLYVADYIRSPLSVIDSTTNVATPTGIFGSNAYAIAFTPDGKTAYVANAGNMDVSVIDTATRTESAAKIVVGGGPEAIAVTPDGRTAYVASFDSDSVRVIDTATNEASPTTIPVGSGPSAIAVTPDGRTAYVANSNSNTVSVIDTTTNMVGPQTIPVGTAPEAIAVTPDGKTAYVTNLRSNSVSVIDTTTNTAAAIPIAVGRAPWGIAISPDGRTAYVANSAASSVSAIDTATNTVNASAINVGTRPIGIAITPDGRTVYTANLNSGNVSVIDTATRTTGTPIPVGENPIALAVEPSRSPIAAFSAPATAHAGAAVSFDASASRDPDSPIAGYSWSFGDGQGANLAGPSATHVFSTPGTYTVSLKETDADGCSTARALVYTGQSPFGCLGGAGAQTAATITVLPATSPTRAHDPRVKVSCPRSAKPKGCLFKLQAVFAKPKRGKAPKAESAIAKAKVKAGRSATVTLHPTPAFAAKLDAARSVLVKETVVANGASRTRYARLRVVK